MITSSLNWWTEQMRDLVPASLRLSGQAWRRALIVVTDPSDAAIAELLLGHRGGAMLLKDIQTANADCSFFDFVQRSRSDSFVPTTSAGVAGEP